MDLLQLKEYPHKIIKITVNNKNESIDSMCETALFKVTIPQKADNEIILFSYNTALTETIPRTKSGNDYFLTIPNVEGQTIIYAHILISDLYNHTEEEENDGSFVNYDLKKFKTKGTGTKYNVSDDDHPQISSLMSIQNPSKPSRSKDPNYKQYNIDKNGNKVLKGRFPISSRYATDTDSREKELVAPDIEQTPAEVFKRETTYDGNNLRPEWEIHIPRTDIGDIIPKDTGRSQHPINVFLNYEYLPSSTEYHQHFYGFEGYAQTHNNDINIFEGDNLDTVNGVFNGDKSYTYRLINAGDPFDHQHAEYVGRTNNIITPTELSDPIIINNSCDWMRNECENYFIYTSLSTSGRRGLYYPVTLKSDTSYILKYYVYVPNNIDGTDSDCYIEVQSIDTKDGSIIKTWSIDGIFKKQDKFLTNQWVYHEVPFRTTVDSHRLYVKGHNDVGKDIYFSDFYIEEIAQYSPTIKYTNRDVFVVENDISVGKPNDDYLTYNKGAVQTPTNIPPKVADVTEPATPYNDIFVHFEENFDIDYNTKSKILSYYPNDGYEIQYDPIIAQGSTITGGRLCINNKYNKKEVEENGHTITVEDKQSPIFTYDSESGKLYFDYKLKQQFTYGSNNHFKLKIGNEHNEGVGNGFVECAITEDTNENDNIKADTVKYLGKKYCDDNGNVEYKRIDFTKIKDPERNSNEYFLRIDYTHPCFDRKIIVFKKVFFKEEELVMDITIDNATPKGNKIYEISNEEDFPLEIIAYIHQKHDNTQASNWGYCELSIDDEVKQTSYVNDDGIAQFFLNRHTDNIKQSQIIKIEYYREYNTVEVYDFFTLNLAENFEGRDAVPIRFNILSNINEEQEFIEQGYIQKVDKVINIQKDDCLLIDIDTSTNKYVNYSIRLYKNNGEYITFSNNKKYINITSISNDSIVIGDFIDDKNSFNTPQTIKYTIVTDSLIKNIDANNNITYSNNKYRRYEKHITVTWTGAT